MGNVDIRISLKNGRNTDAVAESLREKIPGIQILEAQQVLGELEVKTDVEGFRRLCTFALQEDLGQLGKPQAENLQDEDAIAVIVREQPL